MIFLKALILSGLFILLAAVSALYLDSNEPAIPTADYAIVYGNKVEITGIPSNRLAARLNAATQLYHEKKIEHIIVSGGTGKEGFDEAKVMLEYLVSQNIPESIIITDADGYTSHKTSVNAAHLIGTDSSVIAVSQRYHVSRTKLSLRNAGFHNVQGFYPDHYEFRDIYATFRELPAWLKYWWLKL